MEYKIFLIKNIIKINDFFKKLKINKKKILNFYLINYFFPVNKYYDYNLYNKHIKKFIKLFIKNKSINIWNKCIQNYKLDNLYFSLERKNFFF
ncbi:MAG: hypothetical protein V9V01_00375 [Candidatus Shikimatogenerans sp. Tmey]